MKRFKTWKRWALVNLAGTGMNDGEGGDIVEMSQPVDLRTGKPDNDFAELVLRRAVDDRKVMAVYNAAMNSSPTAVMECNMALHEACERARK